jgi:hypothetical protein
LTLNQFSEGKFPGVANKTMTVNCRKIQKNIPEIFGYEKSAGIFFEI